jgi:menaquinone-dependent protoporphyrinogen oxidase
LAEIQATVNEFACDTGWEPPQVEIIAGALVYTQYNFFVCHMMKLIVNRQGRPELDTSQDYDFTDWEAVERFAREFATKVAGKAGSGVR